jgi:NADH-quinone oxidoreductase subunit G
LSLEINMAKIYIDGRPFNVSAENNLLSAILSAGFDLPYFCWHPALHAVGACRQCAVKLFRDEKDTTGKIVMSCLESVKEGMRISVDDPEAKAFRASVIEWLMINHPHDCPVCDEGGECHLQDMAVMSGQDYRRYRFKKRTYRNQYLGPFLNHEMNRCIHCYRCVRFYRDYAGGTDLGVLSSHDHVYFGRHKDGVLESEFSGNLVEVCPTGVFTDKTFKQHYSRIWDLTTSPSICVHCSLGCNIIAGERYGTLCRIRNRYNGKVNGYFLCDRGRYGYAFVNSERRILRPRLRDGSSGKGGSLKRETLIQQVAPLLAARRRVIGIGSPRASLEANFVLRKLVGSENFYSGVPDSEAHLSALAVDILKTGPARSPSLREAERADAVLILGEDLLNCAPMLGLAIRQAVRQKPLQTVRALNIPLWQDSAAREVVQDERGPLFVASVNQSRLDDIATEVFRRPPDDIARLGFDIAHHIKAKAPGIKKPEAEARSLARKIARALKESERPLIISGVLCGSESIIQAAANIAWALYRCQKDALLGFVFPECNSLGLALLEGAKLSDAFSRVKKREVDTAIILENDLYRRANSLVTDEFFESCPNIVVLDHLENATTSRASIIIPVGTYAESTGTLVNNEGRAQRFYKVFSPHEEIEESWRWLRDAAVAAGKMGVGECGTFDDLLKTLIREMPALGGIQEAAPASAFRVNGQKIPRETHRYSGRTAINANIDVSEPKPPDDPDSALSFTMEGYRGLPPSELIPFYWSPGWNSVQSVNKYQKEVGGSLHGGDPGRRLIEPCPENRVPFFNNAPLKFKPKQNEWYIVPIFHMFGSEELSILTPEIEEQAPEPYILMNEADALKLGLAESAKVEMNMSGEIKILPAKVTEALPPGIAGLPAGLPELLGIVLPGWGRIVRVSG